MCLEFKQHLQRALSNLRLVGRIGGKEFAALDQMVDTGRDMMAIGPCPQEEGSVSCGQILLRQRTHMPLDCHLAHMHGQALDGAVQPRFFGYIYEEIVNGRCTNTREHFAAVSFGQG